MDSALRDDFDRGSSKRQNFRCRQGHVNPVAVNAVPPALSSLPPVFAEAARDCMALVPELLRLLLRQAFAAGLHAERQGEFLFRLDDGADPLEGEIEQRVAVKFFFAVAKVDHCGLKTARKHFLDRAVSLLEGPEAERVESAPL